MPYIFLIFFFLEFFCCFLFWIFYQLITKIYGGTKEKNVTEKITKVDVFIFLEIALPAMRRHRWWWVIIIIVHVWATTSVSVHGGRWSCSILIFPASSGLWSAGIMWISVITGIIWRTSSMVATWTTGMIRSVTVVVDKLIPKLDHLINSCFKAINLSYTMTSKTLKLIFWGN